MKYTAIILFMICSFAGYSQPCGCIEKPELIKILPCDTILIDSQTRIYRQYSCDSSWSTFENSVCKKVLYSLRTSVIESNEKLGCQYVGAFKKVFLVRKKYDTDLPPGYILFDKATGSPVKKMKTILHFSGSTIVYFDHSALDAINVYGIDSGKLQKILLPKDRIKYTLKISGEIYPESLVDNVQIQGSTVSVKYRYQKKEKLKTWFTATATLQLQ